MQNNKKKLLLFSVVIFAVGFFMAGNAQAESCICGSATSSSYSTAPTSNLCQTGTNSSVTPDSGYWNWSCGETCDTVSCQARQSVDLTTCICGSSNGQSFDAAPTSNLCNTGTASSVTGTGPWNWSCGESCGTATCSANKTGDSTTNGTGITFPTNTGLPTNSGLVKGIFTNVANWLLSIIGIIAIISFVISGVQYFLVATDEKMLETAKKTMMTSIIGIVVALFGYIAIKTVEMLLKG
ncbi:MAG: hypothetical protein WC848_02395 [Parcubacteria group bacterium]